MEVDLEPIEEAVLVRVKDNPKCQVLQAEHMNMRIIECIDCYVLMEEGPAHRLIVVLHPLGADQG